ncbi:MAG: polysaccharide biosynthesis C-terminal domain-containing protein [Gammaproteobacteria bacterium]
MLAGTALLHTVLNAALIPFFGMTGAAVATTASLAAWNPTMTARVEQRLGFFVTPFFK